MPKTLLGIAAMALLLGGCSQPPETASQASTQVETSTEVERRTVPDVSTSKTKVVTVESGGESRTDATHRASRSNAEGARAQVQVSASRTGADGSTSSKNQVMKVESAGDEAESLGFTQDDKSVAVSGSNVTRDFAVEGHDVAVSGNGNTLAFTGSAHGLSVTGSNNQITIEKPEMIDVSGANNTVRYSGSQPAIQKSGEDNVVANR